MAETTKLERSVSVLKSVVEIGAILVGGWWAYDKFTRTEGPLRERKLEPNRQSTELAQKEYEAMRTLILEGIKETHTLERYTLVAVAVFWTWLFSQSDWRPWMQWAKFLPSVLVLLAALRSAALLIFVLRIAKYVHSIESLWGLGWEHYIKAEKTWIMTILGVVFWFLLLGICLVVGIAFEKDWLIPTGLRPPPLAG